MCVELPATRTVIVGSFPTAYSYCIDRSNDATDFTKAEVQFASVGVKLIGRYSIAPPAAPIGVELTNVGVIFYRRRHNGRAPLSPRTNANARANESASRKAKM